MSSNDLRSLEKKKLKIGFFLDDLVKVVFSPTIKNEKIGQIFISLFLYIKTMHACKFL